jgi:hypothetical protein
MAGLSVFCLALSNAPAMARPAHGPPARSCCHVPAGALVEVELADQLSTKVQRSGDSFALRLTAPLIVDGRIVLPAGTPGVGQVVDSARPGMGGKPGELVLAARYLERRGVRTPLEGLQLAAAGRDNSNAAQVVGLSGIVFGPLGLAGMAVQGGAAVFPAGTRATARIADDVDLASLGRASRAAVAHASAELASDAAASVDVGSIEIPPPPAGEGQVIFFRDKSLLGTGQWFNVREDGKALGKLDNGAYFIQVTQPGPHSYTATEEPELKSKLKLEVDAGESYFVRGTLTKGLVIGAADLSPSDRATFNKDSKSLKLAASPAVHPTDAASDGASADGDSAASQARAQQDVSTAP